MEKSCIRKSALFTDFYELTMAQGFWKHEMNHPAVFDMFFRRQAFKAGFSVFSGIKPLLETLSEFCFSKEDLAYLSSLDFFDPAFLDYLKDFRFRGDLYAMDEGSIIFPNEPIIRVHANMIEAQIIEGLVLNCINFESLIATKAARIWHSSGYGNIMEFGLRRAQGSDGAMSASRAAYIGGASSTSNTLAGKRYGIPVKGTMAHSWIMSFPSEREAFETYAELFPNNSIFLIDTYETLGSGIENAIFVGKKLKEKGYNFGVRLDSGDIHYLSVEVRKRLDAAGLRDAFITVSNELSEEIIENLLLQKAPIDSWGVGTNMVTGGNESSFTGVYKLSAHFDTEGKMHSAMKFSDNPEKTTNPGIKNVWRIYDQDGMAKADVLALIDETISTGKSQSFYHPSIDYRQFNFKPAKVELLLKQKIKNGKLLDTEKSNTAELQESRETMIRQLNSFDNSYKRLLNPHVYKVSISEGLKDLKLKHIQNRLGH